MSTFARRHGARLACLLPIVLAACGGGGSDPPADAGTPGAGTPPVGTSPAPDPAPAPLATCGLPDFQSRLLARVNVLRAAGADCGSAGHFEPTGPLAWQGQLDQAATGHATDMATQDYFSHTSLDGRTMRDRIDATGYPWRNLGENIAAGYPDVDTVMDGWRASDGHCANLMNPAFTEVGVGCVDGSSSRYGRYWAMNLGRPR